MSATPRVCVAALSRDVPAANPNIPSAPSHSPSKSPDRFCGFLQGIVSGFVLVLVPPLVIVGVFAVHALVVSILIANSILLRHRNSQENRRPERRPKQQRKHVPVYAIHLVVLHPTEEQFALPNSMPRSKHSER